MIVDNDKYQNILTTGLSLDHYFILEYLREGKSLPSNKRIQGFLNLLIKKEYVNENQEITKKGLDLIGKNSYIKIVRLPKIDSIHKKCQDKIFELTGKKQIVSKISGKSYSFLCNEIDLDKTLFKVMKTYDLKDIDKIEKFLLRYIQKCYDEKNWFPIMQYYIFKDNSSKLVTDMENIEDDDIQNYKSLQKLG